MTKNRVWKDIYDALLTCRRNTSFFHPKEFLSIPINGEPLITKNRSPVNQAWCSQLMIKDIMTYQGDWRDIGDYNTIQKPISFELAAIKDAIEDYIDEYK